jgi:hypothetical protein
MGLLRDYGHDQPAVSYVAVWLSGTQDMQQPVACCYLIVLGSNRCRVLIT